MNLWKYESKQVKITYTDGGTLVGYADIYHEADDNASGIASLTVAPQGSGNNALIDVGEDEIANIEVIATNFSELPEAI